MWKSLAPRGAINHLHGRDNLLRAQSGWKVSRPSRGLMGLQLIFHSTMVHRIIKGDRNVPCAVNHTLLDIVNNLERARCKSKQREFSSKSLWKLSQPRARRRGMYFSRPMYGARLWSKAPYVPLSTYHKWFYVVKQNLLNKWRRPVCDST